jgi:ketosteroid isomerase-like protein
MALQRTRAARFARIGWPLNARLLGRYSDVRSAVSVTAVRTGPLVLAILVASCATTPRHQREASSVNDFQAVMRALAEAWNAGNSRGAADCFTEDAVYTEPPDKQVYRGRDALYSFFGGAGGRPGQMTMQWHHLAFDEKSQVGFGEFSFTYGSTVHGITVVRLRGGKIANWREYWYGSPLPWDQFTRANPF